jgi:hypothetical protein
MAFRKQIVLALAMVLMTICFGCADELNAPNPQDEAPVLPPTNVRARLMSDGDVQVLWDASSQPDINGYNLYRRELATGNPKRLNNSRILDTEFLDSSTSAPKDYEYRVTAVNSKGKESRHTAIVIRTYDPVEDGKAPALAND